MTSAEFAVACKKSGLTISEVDEWNIGFIIDFIYEQCHPGNDKNIDERYNQLKTIEPLVDERYKNGLIGEEKYVEFKRLLSEWR